MALNLAAAKGDGDTLVESFRKGADLNASDQLGCTPLITAAMFGRCHVVRTLLDLGVNLEAKDTWGNTALLRAAQEGRCSTVELLLERGANPLTQDRFDRRTSLMYAALRGHRNVVILLLRYGSDVTIKDSQGLDAYSLARKHRHHRIADIIESHKTPVRESDRVKGQGYKGEGHNEKPDMRTEDNFSMGYNVMSNDSAFVCEEGDDISISSDIAMIDIPVTVANMNGNTLENLPHVQSLNMTLTNMAEDSERENRAAITSGNDSHVDSLSENTYGPINNHNVIYRDGTSIRNESPHEGTSNETRINGNTMFYSIHYISNEVGTEPDGNRTAMLDGRNHEFNAIPEHSYTPKDYRYETQVSELRCRVDYLEDKVAFLSRNVQEQNELLKEIIVRDTMSRRSSFEGGLLSDRLIYQLSDHIGHEWTTLGVALGFPRSKLDHFRADNCQSLQGTIIHMLQAWRDQQNGEDRAKMVSLRDIFNSIQRRDLSHMLQVLLEEMDTDE